MRTTIYKKTILGFLTIIVIMMGVNGYMVYELDLVSNAAHTTLFSDVTSIDLAKELSGQLYDEDQSAGKYLATHDNAYFAIFTAASERLTEELDSLITMQSDAHRYELLQQVRSQHDAFVMNRFYRTGALKNISGKIPAKLRSISGQGI